MADITYTQLQSYETPVNSGKTGLAGFTLGTGANTIIYRSHRACVIQNSHATNSVTVVFSANKNTDGTQIPEADRTFAIPATQFAVVGPLDPSFETGGKTTITVSGTGTAILIPVDFLLN
jgi:hypothetical protein